MIKNADYLQLNVVVRESASWGRGSYGKARNLFWMRFSLGTHDACRLWLGSSLARRADLLALRPETSACFQVSDPWLTNFVRTVPTFILDFQRCFSSGDWSHAIAFVHFRNLTRLRKSSETRIFQVDLSQSWQCSNIWSRRYLLDTCSSVSMTVFTRSQGRGSAQILSHTT